MQQHHSFTIKSQGGTLRVLQTQCGVCEAFDPQTTAPAQFPKLQSFLAIWDTGATGSVITQRVVDACGLKPISMAEVHGLNSKTLSEVYLVNFLLPNNVGVKQVRVTKNLIHGNSDVLIGMDIITIGDFAITNQNNSTTFSFCWPSQRNLDFVEELKNLQQQGVLSQGRKGFRDYRPAKAPKRHK
jgi:Aspartyl protease